MAAFTTSDVSALADIIIASGLFDADWYGSTHADVVLTAKSAETHFRLFGLIMHRPPCPDFETRLNALPLTILPSSARDLVVRHYFPAPTGIRARMAEGIPLEFDEAFYLQTNPAIDLSKVSGPYEHFLRWGHRALRNPGPDFDLVWYAQNYEHEFATPDENPFLHYLREGKVRGYVPHPPRRVTFDMAKAVPLPTSARRACLFAAYDPGLRIDDYVLIFLRDLARHADVFYLADCDMPASELARLDGIVKGAWARRHGAYDFGSYSLLARELVGWERLETYDEVLFVNDSCYLLRPLGEVLETMAARPCAWWGMQATKGLAATRTTQPFPAEDRIDLATIRSEMLERFERDPVYDFHVGSYFMAFRKPVLEDPLFRQVVGAVGSERSKYNIVRKYEVGLTRFLIARGYFFDTWTPVVTRRHPVYTSVIFDLIRDGFPLFKRYFISDNPYSDSALAFWPALLVDVGTMTPVPIIEANVRRLANAERLYRNHAIVADGVLPPEPRNARDFAAYDAQSPKYDHYWGFPVCVYDHTLSDNGRAVFEAVKNDSRITKVVFTRSKAVETDGVNVISVPLKSYEGQAFLARCRHLFVRHGALVNLQWPLAEGVHNVINLWHGIPLKRIGFTSLDLSEHREEWEADNRRLAAVISASDVDRLAMTAAYWPLTFNDIWLTGLPRHDFILTAEGKLPAALLAQLSEIRVRKAGRRMVLFCPTFRNDQKHGYYNFTSNEIDRLSDWLAEHDLVMAIREHPADKARQYSSQLNGPSFLQVSAAIFPDVEMLYREADILVTDYSSVFIDFMLTGRPAISFAYDRQQYESHERGLYYDLEAVFPGPVVNDFPSLMTALAGALPGLSSEAWLHYERCRDFFLKFVDDGNAARVLHEVRKLERGSTFLPGFVQSTEIATSGQERRRIVFLYSVGQNITNRYRIFALLPELQRLGWQVHALDERYASPAVLAGADVVSLCRLEWSERLLDLIEGARACGARIVYDTDDLLHDYMTFTQSEYFRRDPKRANALFRMSSGCRAVMAMVDGFTLSTEPLAASVATFGKPAAVIANTLSGDLLVKYGTLPLRPEGGPVRIAYLSGTATHSRDFEECHTALEAVLARLPEAELHIVGPLQLPDISNAAQIHRHGLMSYAALHDFLRGMDINLAPLTLGAFNDAKSELKIFEAALHGVPTVASPSAGHRRAITSGVNGVLAATPEDWQEALLRLVGDRAWRQRMGEAAHTQIVPQYRAAEHAARLAAFFQQLMDTPLMRSDEGHA